MDHPRAMLFDFSGTLMRIEPAQRWVRAVAEEAGLALSEADIELRAQALIDAGAWYGAYPTRIPEYLAEIYESRDLDEPHHRACYSGLIRESGWPWPELVEPLYERSNAAEAWLPYPDALETLREAKDRGLATAVISNISFDIRPHLKHSGLLELLDAVVLSYEVGLIKPDPAIFQLACDELGVPPESAVMVGDHAADGGGSVLGITTYFVDLVPVEERPDALIRVLREVTAS
ncbi:MAG: HAD-IA family hydrolase [Catenulisporales bacterium]|nr:HAD-IA family hydrolase [Catenulisporales bacterium]